MSRNNGARRGLWIAIYGPDGAGKSAVVRQLAGELAPLFAGVCQYHLRVRWLGAGKPTSPVTDPHAQRPRGAFLSCLKLVYMLAHAWVTHLFVVLPLTVADQLVLFDRYFLDYAVDPRRYRLAQRSVGFARLLARWAPRPDLQFVLDVPAEELQRRKAEVTLTESQRQRRAYVELLGGLSNTVLVNAAQPVSVVANEAASVIRARAGAQGDSVAEVELART